MSGKKLVYTQEEITLMQRSYLNELEQIHRRLIDIFNKNLMKKDVKNDIKQLIYNVCDKKDVINKDIKISSEAEILEIASLK